MGSIGGPEILIVLLVALIVLGPKRLPHAARQVGRAVAEFRRVTSDFQSEVRNAIAEPVITRPPLADPPPADRLAEPQPSEPPAAEGSDRDGASFI